MSDSSSSGGGIGIVGVLTVVFITLKLCGVIDWAWYWVLSPLWIAWALLGFIVGCVVIAQKVLP